MGPREADRSCADEGVQLVLDLVFGPSAIRDVVGLGPQIEDRGWRAPQFEGNQMIFFVVTWIGITVVRIASRELLFL